MIVIPNKGPYFQDLIIPDNLDVENNGDEDQALYTKTEELEAGCKRWDKGSRRDICMKRRTAKRHLKKT